MQNSKTLLHIRVLPFTVNYFTLQIYQQKATTNVQFQQHDNHIINITVTDQLTESLDGWGWQGILGPYGPTPVQAGTCRARCPGPHAGSFWRSLRRKLYKLWATGVSSQTTTQHRSASCCSDRISCVPGFAHYLKEEIVGKTELISH